MCFHVIFLLKIGIILKSLKIDPFKRLSWKIWAVFSLLRFPTMYFEQYLCQTCHSLFSGGQDRQELFVPVEVSSPDGNFDTLGKSFFASL
jgi:hypothetical protein